MRPEAFFYSGTAAPFCRSSGAAWANLIELISNEPLLMASLVARSAAHQSVFSRLHLSHASTRWVFVLDPPPPLFDQKVIHWPVADD